MEIITQEELSKCKVRLDLLSQETKKSYEKLQGLCNEIIFIQNQGSIENISSETDNLTDNLLYVLNTRIIDQINRSQSLLSDYEEYFNMFEKLLRQEKNEEG